MNRKPWNQIAGSLLLGMLLSSAVFAQGPDAEQKLVTKVEVAGNKNISGATILAKVRTREGKPFSQVVASDDLKRLYALGYFTDIKIETQDSAEGVAVIFQVEEKPIVDAITLSGNKSIRQEKLQELIKLPKGDFFDLQRLKTDMRDIQKAYEAKGFPLASIDYRLDTDVETNRTKVEIIIQEEERLKIKNIYIQGNKTFSDKKILQLMRTKKAGLFASGLYQEEVLDLDLERLRAFYSQNGFLDAQVNYELSFGPDKNRMQITIQIDEGRQYFVGEVKLQGAVLFPEQQLKQRLQLTTAQVFSKDKLKYDISNIQSFYFEKGYISAEVQVDTVYNEDTGSIDLVYKITENELAYINKIKIRGNTKTKDIVIRRELRSYPGQAFDGEKLKRSKERLYNLGFFQEISYDTEATSAPNQKDLIVNVQEAKTGEFAFGAGFSSVEKFVGFVEIAQRNFDIANWHSFTGAGQDIRVKAEFGTSRREYDLSFTEPWIFGHPLSFGVDGYSRVWERSGTTGYSYDEQRRGGDLRLGKEFTDFFRADLMYKLENVDISNVPDGASQDLKNEVGQNTISSLFLKLTQDTRDNIYSPSKGLVLSASGEVAGGFLGQDKDFFKVMGIADYFKTLVEKLLLELKVVAAVADTYSNTDTLPIYTRYFAGGTNTIRGFKERTVGPQDTSGEPIGGKSTLYGTCELTYPLFELIKIAVFFDGGNVWEKLGDFASGGFKYSAGLGVRVKTPMGPVKLDYGYPLKVDQGEDQEGRFHFSMSRGF
ncbi:MAG: outer membrane protein assembly factor BamA [Candidatus Omnitrophica bacterium]|nr:outer membrane protein assembly factor BamA [Candidatus Omnitrophota bacterium]